MWGILCINFLIFWWKSCHIFLSIFGKAYEKLLEKYEKYFMVSIFIENTVITLCIMTVLNISLLQIGWCFQFFLGCEDSKVRLYSHKKKSMVSKMITKIINDRVIFSSLFKIVEIYYNYNIFVRMLAIFADLYNFLRVCCLSTLTVYTELYSLVLTVNCCQTEKLLTVVQSCCTFWSTAKFTVKYSQRKSSILDARFGTLTDKK